MAMGYPSRSSGAHACVYFIPTQQFSGPRYRPSRAVRPYNYSSSRGQTCRASGVFNLSERQTIQDRPVGYVALVRGNHNYRSVWLGEIVSLFGDWSYLIASATQIAKLTGSGLAVGGLFVVRMLAPFLISPVAGVLADRYDRKKLLIACDLARAVIVLGFLLVRRPDQIWLLYGVTTLQLTLSGVFFPTREAILPDIVSQRELGTANALSATTWSTMLSIGAALGGLATGQWGIYPAFVVDSLSFLLSAASLWQIHF